MNLYCDFETRSAVDLKRFGLWNYARDPSTDVWCMAYTFDDEPIRLWMPGDRPLETPVLQYVLAGYPVVAHNAPFELAIWNEVMVPRYGWPRLSSEQVICTMARCYAMALPGALDNAAAALGLRVTKDKEGHALMLRMCAPVNKAAVSAGADPKWVTDQPTFTFLGRKRTPEWAIARLGEYCKADVDVERAIYARTAALSDPERRIWQLDYQINQRGILFDPRAVEGALRIRDETTAQLDDRMSQVTGGAVQKCSAVSALKEWAADHGVVKESLAKVELAEALDDPDLPPAISAAFNLRREAGRATSVTKLATIARLAGEDGRARYTLQYHGAGTGRWAARGVQTHNFPRDLPSPDVVRQIMRHIEAGEGDLIDLLYGPPLTIISQILRGFIVAGEGASFIGGDFSNVEGRGLAWLAGEDWKIKVFEDFDAGIGPDVYKKSYSSTFDVPVDKVTSDQRQVGKVMELALGYQGGVGAFQTMAKSYGVEIEDEKADVAKVAWRAAHPAIKRYWYNLQEAAIAAVMHQGAVFHAGHRNGSVKFKKQGSFLWALLPSQRMLCYPYPDVRQSMNPQFGPFLSYKSVPSPIEWGAFTKAKQEDRLATYHGAIVDAPGNSRQWARVSTYGGKLAENVTQAICRDILAQAMVRLDDAGYKTVLHVHDEIIVEGEDFTANDLAFVQEVMVADPGWAGGFPLAAECWLAKRYQK